MSGADVPVLIVGAGPTGLACATLLAQQGVRSLVVERHRDVYPLPRAVHLDDEVLRVLQRIGVADAFTAISRPATGMRLLDGDLRTIAEFRRDELVSVNGWPQANLFDQPDLERLMRANLAEYPEAELLGGAEVEHVDPGDAARPARVTIRAADGTRTVTARAVLGCDGANSLVRAAIGAGVRDLRFTERWLVIDVTCPRDLDGWGGVDQVCDPRRAATFMRVGPDRYRWELRMAPGETVADLTSPQGLRTLLARWTRDVPDADLTVVRAAEYTFRAQVADRWRAGRLFLLGDAAHLTPPFIGQGMGAGLRDAANLAWKLALADADPVKHDALLATYELERKPHATRMIRLAVAAGWAMTGGNSRGAALRRAFFARAARSSALRNSILAGPSPRLRPGPLVARPLLGPSRGLPGTLMPQPSVTVGDASLRLDDLLGPGFAVITRDPPTPALIRLAASLNAPILDPAAALLHRPDGTTLKTAHVPDLTRWLHRTRTVLVRPDRTVLTALPSTRPRDRWRSLLVTS
ncbi:bifunctional 3-(3-hydroxy-phenyl)propionate/3-hydroxycinnamic acid hydroxylase [Actinocorallia sp. A-T 12471]|uniref:bifunctional 3-(3-hydroxy-phenyl)propionate/3-hydroxycinnamic acid hydroxylase MhpA n=1 Tax=Actinocorallia sp. A-T 12471 TaxID=3089813 RepID=UPI0029CC8CCF|nr:bifunctional 3-(3-hydroxy-phenyl)propionate/3-hydroxycinnamic acid hydroxylase [Actinocorallia sp. A-T 12471]MDX6740147.1 bifunctional 3-(3-hydroxy-phenyl)propionate/3-hydroxycinnamic acid hydroxylase [Actinocorallia sp. A-T 12471]